MTAMIYTAIVKRATWRELAAAYPIAKRYSPALAALILAEARSRTTLGA